MLFNSLQFVLFLPVVFLLYWFVDNKSLKIQNGLLLAASYFFYASWDYRFLFLLVFSTALDYFTGIRIANAKAQKSRKFWLWLSIIINLGFLGIFKYYNFFIASFADALSYTGLTVNVWMLNVILPVGISFYTFHGLSYVIDIYNKKIQHEHNFIDYAVFVSFFPLLVAGPIERATHLLPQIKHKRTFDQAKAIDGLRQILWGLLKKVVIADTCAVYVNQVFDGYGLYTGSTLLLGAILFAFQIYCDFSGYSDIAIGTAKLFGIDLVRNFAFPYFSRDIAEFWRRWHISLSSWFRDYLYIPLGGNSGNNGRKIRNVFIVFLVSGLWHGANWTFIAWGLINALYFLPLLLLQKNRQHMGVVAQDRLLPSAKDAYRIMVTFLLTVLAWVFFRSPDIQAAFSYIRRIFSMSLFHPLDILPGRIMIFIILFVIIEWLQRHKEHGLQLTGLTIPRVLRWSMYYGIILFIYRFRGEAQQFIYFKF